jgi:hypothetical protein
MIQHNLNIKLVDELLKLDLVKLDLRPNPSSGIGKI